MLACEGIGILPVRKQHDLHVEPFGEEQVDAAQGGVDTGAVAVVHDGGVLGELVYQPYLLHREGGAAGCHHVGYSELMQGHHVHVSLHQDALAAAGNLGLCEPDTQQVAALDVNLSFRRIDVFGRIVGMEGAAAEGKHAPAHGMDGEHHPLAELVGITAVVALYRQACGHDIFHLVARCKGRIDECRLARRRPAQAEACDGGILEPAFAEVGKAHRTSLGSLKLRGIELLRIFRHKQQALAALSAGNLFRTFLLFNNVDMIFGGQVAQGLDIGTMLMFHDEAYRRARLAAAETLVYPLRWRNVKRRSLFVMEGAAGHIIGPAALERHEIPHHVFYSGCIEDKVYCLLGYHEAISHKNLMRTRRISISS